MTQTFHSSVFLIVWHTISFSNIKTSQLHISSDADPDRRDPELLSGSGSGIIVPDPGPAKNERADKLKFYFSFCACVLSLLSVQYCRTVV